MLQFGLVGVPASKLGARASEARVDAAPSAFAAPSGAPYGPRLHLVAAAGGSDRDQRESQTGRASPVDRAVMEAS